MRISSFLNTKFCLKPAVQMRIFYGNFGRRKLWWFKWQQQGFLNCHCDGRTSTKFMTLSGENDENVDSYYSYS